jgi:ferric-dicitrate binding protein FerR (iron transport regulator)
VNLDATPETVQNLAEAIKLAALLDDRVTHPDKARMAAWAAQTHRHRLAREDLLDGVQAFYDHPAEHAIQIGDLIRNARIAKRDRLDRDGPAEPPSRASTPTAAHTHEPEHYPGDAKAAPDIPDYPDHWNAYQRTAAYWYALSIKALPRTTAGWQAIAEQLNEHLEERTRESR